LGGSVDASWLAEAKLVEGVVCTVEASVAARACC
jgi:hypothetical protein